MVRRFALFGLTVCCGWQICSPFPANTSIRYPRNASGALGWEVGFWICQGCVHARSRSSRLP